VLYQLSYSRERYRSTDRDTEMLHRERDIHFYLHPITDIEKTLTERYNKKPCPPSGDHNGGGRIRTFVGISRQIYSLLPLAARAPHPMSAFQSLDLTPQQEADPLSTIAAELTAGIEPATC
jgi:hypothetical protein